MNPDQEPSKPIKVGDGNPPVSERHAKRALRDINFIGRQILRFAKMSFQEHQSYLNRHPMAAFCQIPHPNGRSQLQCGHLAWEKLGALADMAIELHQDIGRRVGRQRVVTEVTNAFARLVLQTETPCNQQTAVLVLQQALASLRQSLAVNEHYIPCVLFPEGESDELRIGPVTFTRRKKFFKDRKTALRESIEVQTAVHIEHVKAHVAKGFARDRAYSELESRQLVRRLQARAIRTYRAYPWIACVEVRDCDESTSQERAAQAVEMAIHIIRVLLGGEETREIRLAWSRSEVLRTAHLHADKNGVISASTGMRSMGPVGAKNWHAAMMRSAWELELFGSSLLSIVDPRDVSHLQNRLLDAISWFGDAATDLNKSSSIVKYVSSIERLLFGKFEKGRKKSFAARVSGVLRAFGCDDENKAHQSALDVYDRRSALVHGERQESNRDLATAARLSRMCLLCSAQLYPMMHQAFDKPDPAKLEEVMRRIGEEGLDWLLKAAGHPA